MRNRWKSTHPNIQFVQLHDIETAKWIFFFYIRERSWRLRQPLMNRISKPVVNSTQWTVIAFIVNLMDIISVSQNRWLECFFGGHCYFYFLYRYSAPWIQCVFVFLITLKNRYWPVIICCNIFPWLYEVHTITKPYLILNWKRRHKLVTKTCSPMMHNCRASSYSGNQT